MKLHTFIKKFKFPIIFIFCLVLIFVELAIVFNFDQKILVSDINSYAQQVIKTCSAVSYKPACFDKEIPQLMRSISMEDAFQVASVVQNSEPSYGYCHVLGHELSARETAKNPNDWKDVIHRCPQGICSNGCLHGAAQERFRGEVLNADELVKAQQELIGVCDKTATWNPTGLEAAECFHGLGHLSMYITGGELMRSVNICDTIAIGSDGKPYNTLCYEGAFMQLFQPLDEEDRVLVKDKGPATKDQLAQFCKQFGPNDKVEACWREGFTMYQSEIHTSSGTVKFCSNPIVKEVSHCYQMLYYVNAQNFEYDATKLATYCDQMPTAQKPECFGNVANAIIHGGNRLVDQAAAFCSYAKDLAAKNGCYDIIVNFATYNLAAGSEAYNKLCSNLPEPYLTRCKGNKEI